MSCPETPTLRRKSSNKRIVISSPSREMLHFLTLPNPAATEDPRHRLHIITPKHRQSQPPSSPEAEPPHQALRKTPSASSRVAFLRREPGKASWGKREGGRLVLEPNFKSRVGEWKGSCGGLKRTSQACLNITFGSSEFMSCLKV